MNFIKGIVMSKVRAFVQLLFIVLSFSIYAEDQKNFHLTFDDGPSGAATTKILDILKQEGVKATFFVVGNKITEKNLPIIKRMKEEGHVVGFHANRHISFYTGKEIGGSAKIDLFKEDGIYNKEKAKEMLVPPKIAREYIDNIFRFPGGNGAINYVPKTPVLKSKHEQLQDILCKDCLFQGDIGWDIDSDDWRFTKKQPEKIINNVLRQCEKTKAGVVLMHDNHSAGALEQLIKEMKSRKYKLSPLNTAFRQDYVSTCSAKKIPCMPRDFTTPENYYDNAELRDCPAIEECQAPPVKNDFEKIIDRAGVQ